MSEMINLISKEDESHILLMILSSLGHVAVKEITDFKPDVTVDLKINGYDVSFRLIMDALFQLRKDQIDKLVGEKLAEITKLSKLKDFIDKIDSIQYQLKDGVEKLVGTTIDWPDSHW